MEPQASAWSNVVMVINGERQAPFPQLSYGYDVTVRNTKDDNMRTAKDGQFTARLRESRTSYLTATGETISEALANLKHAATLLGTWPA